LIGFRNYKILFKDKLIDMMRITILKSCKS
jgi:hypothetical protein